MALADKDGEMTMITKIKLEVAMVEEIKTLVLAIIVVMEAIVVAVAVHEEVVLLMEEAEVVLIVALVTEAEVASEVLAAAAAEALMVAVEEVIMTSEVTVATTDLPTTLAPKTKVHGVNLETHTSKDLKPKVTLLLVAAIPACVAVIAVVAVSVADAVAWTKVNHHTEETVVATHPKAKETTQATTVSPVEVAKACAAEVPNNTNQNATNKMFKHHLFSCQTCLQTSTNKLWAASSAQQALKSIRQTFCMTMARVKVLALLNLEAMMRSKLLSIS
jgi:hypothetical protein